MPPVLPGFSKARPLTGHDAAGLPGHPGHHPPTRRHIVVNDTAPPWKSAGVRYTADEWATAQREAQQRAHRAKELLAQIDQEGHRRWAAGELIPWAITRHLDLAGLEGPQVDINCGAMEPDVDQWELGILYPTWEQTQKLAALCGISVRALCRMPTVMPGTMFICGRGARALRDDHAAHPPVVRFTQHALDARLAQGVDAGGRLW